jgi:hypothetical protein
MFQSGAVRASDAERERAMRDLRRHFTEGRLDAAELEERIARVSRARTRGELHALFADLPRDLGARAATAADRANRALLRAHVATYGAINGGAVGLWALEGAHAFWPAWLIVPWGIALAAHARTSRAVRRALHRRADLSPPGAVPAGERSRQLAP